MIVTFSYPLPDELYVEGVSGNLTGTYTYDGPETFDVHIDIFGNVIDVDVQNDPELGSDYRKIIDASKQVEVAYIINRSFYGNVWEYQYEDETMENGDVYKKPINLNLIDAYQVIFDFTTNEWKLNQIVKQQDNLAALEAQRRKEYIQKYAEKYSFGEAIDIAIETYIEELDTFIVNNPPLKSWKYINFNLNTVPKIPAIIAIEISKLPSEGV